MPTWSATNRYVWVSPFVTAFCVTPATPSSAFGTSTPCQCNDTPSSTEALRRCTSTSCPSVAVIVGPGVLPLRVNPSISRPEASLVVP